MSKNNLDEMQLQRKNKIGNQSFLMLFYLLMLDIWLYSFGFKWISYPANVVFILTFCGGIYFLRLIIGNSYQGPDIKKEKPLLKIVLTVLGSLVAATAIIVIFKNAGFSTDGQINDTGAIILLITSSIAIILVLISTVIKKRQNKNDEE
ncbi:DUF6773 family protein [Clostridium vincentii]|uniref:Uncharacterized protein n=1 Tax=Clostridium vincentii TaxID=52704 RepID=A0A2T0BIY8_9CLOT|nr:DUF6773 family protein [Clostridium vincentii]PRR83817.1 hypothetical protein CLVI_07650 [Clostridium vincentii]